MGTTTEFSPGLQPPDEIDRSLFGRGRRVAHAHPLAIDALVAAVLLAVCTVWLVQSPFASWRAGLVQAALIAVIAVRRVWPTAVFLAAAAIGFAQWLLGFPLLGDVALLIALYTVAAHQSRTRALLATGVMEAGAVMAAVRWEPAGTLPRSLLFLTATVVAALFAGMTAASGSRYLAWMDERARRLELERDQQATIAAAAERTRIARELHDIVSHSLAVVITLADAAALVSQADPDQGAEAMAEVSEVGRRALSDMRAMLGVLRTDEPPGSPVPQPPQPGVGQLGALVERIRATGLAVSLTVEGTAFPLGAAAELTAYRIVQEALTNTLRHAAARHAAGHGHLRRARSADPGGRRRRLGRPGARATASRPTREPRPWRRRDAGAGRPAPRRAARGPGRRRRMAGRGHPPAPGGPGRPGGAGMTISVLLADDQPLLRRGFRMILEAEGDLTVVAEAGDGEEAVEQARRHVPDVVLMDIRMPGTDGIEATRRITAADERVRVLVLTTFDLDEYAFGAARAGASGFLLKDVRPADLVAAVRTVASGDAVVSPRVTRRLLEEYARVVPLSASQMQERYPQLATLTEREREVLIAVAGGLSNAEIAASLYVSEATVKSHVGRILAKLGLRDRVQVVVLAYEAGLIRPGADSAP